MYTEINMKNRMILFNAIYFNQIEVIKLLIDNDNLDNIENYNYAIVRTSIVT